MGEEHRRRPKGVAAFFGGSAVFLWAHSRHPAGPGAPAAAGLACNTPVIEGMVVQTKSDKAESGRRAVLEFLLANHPLDCPVCDQSGECDLQNFYLDFGLYDPRFREQKVKKHKAVALGTHVMLDQERCILCSRCII